MTWQLVASYFTVKSTDIFLQCELYKRDRAWFVRLYGEIISSFNEGIIDRTGAKTMLYLTCTMISSVNHAHYGVFHAKDLVSVDCGTIDRNSWFI